MPDTPKRHKQAAAIIFCCISWANRSSACFHGRLAQLGEHLLCKQGVTGSSPVLSTMNLVRKEDTPMATAKKAALDSRALRLRSRTSKTLLRLSRGPRPPISIRQNAPLTALITLATPLRSSWLPNKSFFRRDKPGIIWPVGQEVKTRPFHGCNTSSILVRVTRACSRGRTLLDRPSVTCDTWWREHSLFGTEAHSGLRNASVQMGQDRVKPGQLAVHTASP